MLQPLKYKFDQALEFPCDQHFRIIVDKEDGIEQRLVDAINEILPNSTSIDHVLNSRLSANQKYISYTVSIRFEDARSIEILYAKLAKVTFVKHIL